MRNLEQSLIARIVADEHIPWELLKGKSVVVTGATGLIGSALTKVLLAASSERLLNMEFILPVRNRDKAMGVFGSMLNEQVRIVELECFTPSAWSHKADYMIHAAAPTDSSQFVQQPVEVIDTIYHGTMNVLQIAKNMMSASVLFLSTMEVYGTPHQLDISETEFGALDPTVVRSSYPESKRLAECLCASFAAEYHVPVKIARLTQTFGLGVHVHQDQRVFAQFARSALSGKDIVLHTKGQTERCYVDVMDAVSACIYILLKGSAGQAYNVANPETFCSIYHMASMVAQQYGIRIRIEESPEQSAKYCPPQKVLLNVNRLQALGWQPAVSLMQSFQQMLTPYLLHK